MSLDCYTQTVLILDGGEDKIEEGYILDVELKDGSKFICFEVTVIKNDTISLSATKFEYGDIEIEYDKIKNIDIIARGDE